MPRPASFSGDDTVEFSSHGGTLVPARLVAACLAAGARLALPGEFSRRAVINGKLDLLQAEGMADLIAATAPAQARQALAQLDGALSARITGLRAAVLACQALLAYAIDFPEEDDGPVSSDRIMADLTELQFKLRQVAATSVEGFACAARDVSTMSWTSAVVIFRARMWPNVPTKTCRFLPVIFLPAS